MNLRRTAAVKRTQRLTRDSSPTFSHDSGVRQLTRARRPQICWARLPRTIQTCCRRSHRRSCTEIRAGVSYLSRSLCPWEHMSRVRRRSAHHVPPHRHDWDPASPPDIMLPPRGSDRPCTPPSWATTSRSSPTSSALAGTCSGAVAATGSGSSELGGCRSFLRVATEATMGSARSSPPSWVGPATPALSRGALDV
jgi:hypothetical protein